LGFALTEGLIASPADVQDYEEAAVEAGGFPAREARLWLRPGLAAGLAERRRSMVGPVGCGLCGVDSIAAALPQVVPVASGWAMPPADVGHAMQALAEGQRLRRVTPAIHGAAFWDGTRAITREDVGRHNALDKLAGALARDGIDPGQGAIVMSSRLSVDLVQKAARIGAPVLIGASAPTGLALDWAERAGITLIARARGASFDLYTHPRRVAGSRGQ
jgi:FdhD protein